MKHSINASGLVSLSIFLTFFSNSCAPRKFNSQLNLNGDNRFTSNHKDVFAPSDLSVLFPPAGLPHSLSSGLNTDVMSAVLGVENAPGTDMMSPSNKVISSSASIRLANLSQKGMWPALVADNGKGFLSTADFDSIIGVFPQTKTLLESASSANSANKKSTGPFIVQSYQSLTEYIDFSLKVWKEGMPEQFQLLRFDMSEQHRWRVVSFRFDPCPYGHLNTNSSGVSKILDVSKFNQSRCLPEIRVIAQPILGLKEAESELGNRLPQLDIETRSKKFVPKQPRRTAAIERITSTPKDLGWYFGDFAVHLFFRVAPKQVNTVFARLLDLKKRHTGLCGDTPLPLTVNPCLTRILFGEADPEKLVAAFRKSKNYTGEVKFDEDFIDEIKNKHKNWSKIQYANELNEIIRSTQKDLYKVAAFISSSAKDPWIFRLLDRDPKSGKLELARIKALETDRSPPIVRKLADENSPTGFKEVILEPLEGSLLEGIRTAKVQIVPRGARVTAEKNTDYVDDFRARMYPTSFAERDSLESFVRDFELIQRKETYEKIINRKNMNLRGLQNITVTKSRESDLKQTAARINNPYLNDEFSTDCASCHLATPEKRLLNFADHPWSLGNNLIGGQLNPLAQTVSAQGLIERHGASSQWRTKHSDFDLWNRFEFKSPRKNSLGVGLDNQKTAEATTDHGFVFNQFSIYRSTPHISDRVANETELAVYLSNKWFLKTDEYSNYNCDFGWLRACLNSTSVARTSWLRVETLTKRCLAPEAAICKPD